MPTMVSQGPSESSRARIRIRRPRASSGAEEQRRESFVHDGRLRPGMPIVVRQRPPAQNPRAEHLEVAGADAHHEHGGRQLLRRRPAVHLDHRGRPGPHDAGRADAGRGVQVALELRGEADLFLRVRVLPGGKRDFTLQNAFGIEAQVDAIHLVEAPQHQPRPAQQNERERRLDDDHRGAQAAGPDAVGSRAAALLQEPADRRPR